MIRQFFEDNKNKKNDFEPSYLKRVREAEKKKKDKQNKKGKEENG